ncbi:MAG: ABC transporter ATP-binding protein [Acidimicrobiales bacterium]|nr:ABC transporter ATP-binding protein [Acidimicrobiales bacterium]
MTAAQRPSALRRSLSVCRPHLAGNGWIAGGGLAAMLFEVAMRLVEPWPVRAVVDGVIPATVEGPTAGAGGNVTRTVTIAAIATVAVVGLRALASFASTVAFAVAGSRVTSRLRAQAFDHVLGLSMRFHDRTRPGDLVVRLTGDVQRLQEVTVSAALPLLGNVALFVGMVSVMVWLDPVLALAVLAVVPLFTISGRKSGGRITEASREQRRNEGAIASTAAESLGAMKVVHAYGLGPALARSFAAGNESSLRTGVRSRRLAAGLERRTDVIVGLATATVLYVGARRVIAGALTPGELVVFLSYLKTAFRPMRDIAKYTGRIARAAASGERIADLLEVESDITSKPGAWRLRRARGLVEFEDVSIEYEPGHRVLEHVNLRILPGEKVAIVGDSGAGKSTLASTVLRFVDPAEGRVLVDGHDVRDLTLDSLRANVAVVLQESVLFAATIAENVRAGRPDASLTEVWQALVEANAAEFVAALPDGVHTMLGQRGATLSGGQRQRIAIARAIIRDAPIVVLDEPTTGLDRTAAEEVMVALDRLGRTRTTLVVAHDALLVDGCDRVVEVVDGSLREVSKEWTGGRR